MKKNMIGAILCAGLLLIGGLYYFNREEPPPKAPITVQPADTTGFLSFNGSSYVERKDGKAVWEIAAETIEMDPATKLIYLKGIKAVFYQEDGERLDITAPVATMDSKTKNITMDGDVKAVSSKDGAVFTARQALWAAQEQKLTGAGGITLTRDDTVITGDLLETDPNTQKYKVRGHVRVLTKGAE